MILEVSAAVAGAIGGWLYWVGPVWPFPTEAERKPCSFVAEGQIPPFEPSALPDQEGA